MKPQCPTCCTNRRCIITCKRGSAKHSVKDDFAFLWKHPKFGYPHNWNPWTDHDETSYSWLRWPKNPQCKHWWRSAGWGLLHEWVKYNAFACFFLSFFFFSNSPTAQTERPIYAYYIPKDVVWAKDVPFGGRNYKKLYLGELCPQNPHILGRE